jgi:hypothetical protein
MIGNSPLSVDDASNMSLKGRHFKGTKRIRDLSRKNVYKAVITTDDLKRYKTILQVTNAHL